MPTIPVRWQVLIAIVLVFASVFSTIYTNRFLENQEKNQIEFNQKRLTQKAVEAIMPTVKAQSPQEFRKLSTYITNNNFVETFCHAGNLIYLYNRSGIWGVPNSTCNPPPPRVR